MEKMAPYLPQPEDSQEGKDSIFVDTLVDIAEVDVDLT